MDQRNFITDRVLGIYNLDKTDRSVNWSINQVKGFTMNATMESREIKDALDMNIAELGKAKGLELGGDNALFDFGLLAAQFGSDIEESSETVKFLAPAIDDLVVGENGKCVTKHVPNGEAKAGIPFIYTLNNDGSFKMKYAYAAQASEDAFTFTTGNGDGVEITAPTSVKAGEKIAVLYEYMATGTDKAARIVDNAEMFPESGEVWIKVLFRNVCNKEIKYAGYIKCTNAQLDGNFDLNLASDGTHPFKIRAMQNYCDADKQLCAFYIPGVVEQAG